MSKPEIVVWSASSVVNEQYDTTTWYRAVGIQEFVEKVIKTHDIIGVIFSGNNIGFIIKPHPIVASEHPVTPRPAEPKVKKVRDRAKNR